MKKLIKINKETLYWVDIFSWIISSGNGNSYLFELIDFKHVKWYSTYRLLYFYGLSASINIKSLIFVSVFYLNCNTYISNYHA